MIKVEVDRPQSDAAVRRLAARRGYRLHKLRENSRWYPQYGPWMVCDADTGLVLEHSLTNTSAARIWIES